MSDIDVVSFNFNGATVNADVAWTSDVVAQGFRNNLGIFFQVSSKTDMVDGVTSADATEVTGPDAAAMTESMNNLILLAQNGLTHSVDQQDPLNTTTPQQTYYLTVDMLRDLQLLIKSLQSAGWEGPGNAITEPVAELWRSMAASSPDILTSLLESSSIANRSIQSLVELEYVKTGNDVLSDQLGDLETALQTTKDVLGTLQELQDVHNNIVVKGKGMFNWFNTTEQIGAIGHSFGVPLPAPPLDTGVIEIFQQRYRVAGSAFFGAPIDPSVNPDANISGGLVGDLLDLRARIKKQRDELLMTTPKADLDDPNIRENTLVGKLEKVLADINKLVATDGADGPLKSPAGLEIAVQDWILDNYKARFNDNSSDAGLIQQNITFAITAGQSLNDTQKEEVRRFMFLFEEFYKSASAILTKISQILEKIAQGISR